uniref:ShKT domain-containing protein n=1 Tax=Panagrolaimus sp. JU765 TaxID=591449 RepID=A0AC34RGB3_9BILA
MKLLFLLLLVFGLISMVLNAPLETSDEENERCEDKSEYCKFMKARCFDVKYSKLMKTQCRQTCGFC